MNEPIRFGVSDMVRGKCMFSSLVDLNECCALLKEAISKSERCKLVEVDNRLTGKTNTSDLVMKILLGNTVAELQLAYLNNAAAYEFSHKLYELQRSKFFSPLTTLHRLHQKMGSEYYS